MNKYISILLLLLASGSLSLASTTRGAFVGNVFGAIASNALLSATSNVSNTDGEKESNDPISEMTGETSVTRRGTKVRFAGKVTVDSCSSIRTALEDARESSMKITSETGLVVPVRLEIRSYGGALLPAFGVCDLLNGLDIPTETIIDSYAASAGHLIAVSGQRRLMTKHSFGMMHQLRGGSQGPLEAIKEQLENMDLFLDSMIDIYRQHSNITIINLRIYPTPTIHLKKKSKTCKMYLLVHSIFFVLFHFIALLFRRCQVNGSLFPYKL